MMVNEYVLGLGLRDWLMHMSYTMNAVDVHQIYHAKATKIGSNTRIRRSLYVALYWINHDNCSH